ncbi:hypothetical protein [Sphingomonas sp. SRS2]|uniref:hypothetical protein n=1 Tax=Sphingomonas sp. SRS2 TaxID=133190 RepID=UPI000AB2930C|nr:hypothetical protein [Sphingomonas sp. SRS2]
MEKKSEDMHIRMEMNLRNFIGEVADLVERPPSTVARIMLRDWLRLGHRGAAEAIQHLEDESSTRT